MRTRAYRAATSNRRRGLSTLEMALCLPILLLIMALMINFGAACCWKVRSLTVSRHAAWSSRWPRSTQSNPRPESWPASGHIGVEPDADVPQLDNPQVDHPVARGPLPQGTVVHTELLDPTRGLRHTSAKITRDFPMLKKMGQYDLEANTRLLDNKWQYLRMSWPEKQYGLSSTVDRRIPVIYELAKAPRGVVNAYLQALLTILRAPFAHQLAPLDHDADFLKYRGYAPDFYQFVRLREFCSPDREAAAFNVEDLIDRIQGHPGKGNPPRKIPSLAEHMTRAFLGLYKAEITRLQSLLDSNVSPLPGEMATIRSQISQLESKVDQLERFQATL